MKSCFYSLLPLALLSVVPHLAAQGTAFTYQGQLLAGGTPANGSFDLTFTLFVTNHGGAPLTATVTNRAAAVTNGLFTTMIDFGPGVFTGGSNWLELAVETNGGSGFITLAPRQPLTPVPYAVTAAALSGNLPLSQIPAAVLTNGAGGVTLGGQFSGNGVGLTNLPGSALTGVLPPTALPSSVAQLPANQTFTGSNNFTTSVGIGTSHPTALLQLNSTNQLSEPLRLSGQERYNAGFTACDGISLLLGVNRVDNRQLGLATAPP